MNRQSNLEPAPLETGWEDPTLNEHGRWVRQGNRIVLVLGDQAMPREEELGEEPADALRQEMSIELAIRRGVRDENRLTDMVFNARHPERHGQRLQPQERELIQEWLDIRNRLVRPALQEASARSTPVAPAVPAKPAMVPGMPGVTIPQLVEKWRQQIAPEIPLAVLLAFIQLESGGHFDNATHGRLIKDKSGVLRRSPEFYEIGLFQTPAGKHGDCSGTGERWLLDPWKCTYPPPGREDPNDLSDWHKLCTHIGTDPGDWRNPTTQVRVGLLNLKNSATAVADKKHGKYPHLFPTVGSDWYIRMAVLMPFAGGAGYTSGLLKTYGTRLAILPEDQRWDFLRGKIRYEYEHNIDAKMALAKRLGYAR